MSTSLSFEISILLLTTSYGTRLSYYANYNIVFPRQIFIFKNSINNRQRKNVHIRFAEPDFPTQMNHVQVFIVSTSLSRLADSEIERGAFFYN